ncbi:GNAT family N-acetyltransferase [Permianibacter sp. IMCC34836]|uniref:GNAT family N-acetyltransferase n=1 Tax=Permianibacter fluminis TaxID=2738515 RepID=UPI0015539598|nr:GNAT family N-acetyltransferase [Permianibacter fluminis]NQD37588.1 GNAT family N-acetyltransferase [Permianibacter fluminis]
MSDVVRVRVAVVADAESVARLLTELGYPTEPATAAGLIAAASADEQQTVLVIDVGGQVSGLAALVTFFYFHQGKRIARLSSLVVSDAVRGQGLGRRLLRAAEDWAKARDCAQIELTSSSKRERAHAFYQREGYTQSSYRFVRDLS